MSENKTGKAPTVGKRLSVRLGAGRGNRTPTGLLAPADFKSAASANFAIPARNSF